MIKDIVVNLPLRADKDRTTAFAASLAGYFGAHVTGIAFMYWPLFVCVQMGAAEAQFIKKHDAAAKEAADAAVDRLAFEIRREECVLGLPPNISSCGRSARPLRRNRPHV